MKSISEFFRPTDLAQREQRYHFNAQLSVLIPTTFIALFVIYFNALDVPKLPVLYSFLVSIMVISNYFVFKRKYFLSSLINVLTHLVFISTGMIILGWKSGLQFHLIPIALLTQYNMVGMRKYKLGVAILCVLTFEAAAIYTNNYPPAYQLADTYLDILLYFNILVSLGVFMELNGVGGTLEKFEEKLIQSNLKNEQLLHNILPISIANQLKENEKNIVDRYEQASILFADLVNFTPLAEDLSPKKIVEILNGLFTRFDNLTEEYGIEKIKTIGDAYMVASGVPNKNDNHATDIFLFAKEMLEETNRYNQLMELNLKLRIGISSGSVVAGVIGKKKFSFDLWGDTVNMAARMESNGQENKIQVSENTYQLLKEEFTFDKFPNVEIKGKGKVDVFVWNPAI